MHILTNAEYILYIIGCLQKFRLIDTAGIRKRAAVASSGSTTEALSVNRAFRAIRRSDVVALVIEALACITEQVKNNVISLIFEFTIDFVCLVIIKVTPLEN